MAAHAAADPFEPQKQDQETVICRWKRKRRPVACNFYKCIQSRNDIPNRALVISEVNGSFGKWLSLRKENELFDQCTMRPLLKNMVIQLVGLVESVLLKNKCPVGLSMKDLYIKILHNGTAKLQVLIPEVQVASQGLEVKAWKSVRTIVDGCFAKFKIVPDEATRGFISSIGILTKNTEVLFADFPDQWDNSRKGAFLMESCAHANIVSSTFNAKDSGLRWPLGQDGETPWVLQQLIYRGQKFSQYNKDFPYDYVKLCRNTYKHFDELPKYIKNKLGGDKDGLLNQMEKWTPGIWRILYVAVHKNKK
ncbi:hypothetical protein CFC21_042933 [Triticum aestivum]|uniref:KEN domain-containing protein n=2 Tax=Triticum aestivum TaxID=4565 RepID=A0A3B6FSV7_WHEAT|nr:uncharacterized protein LOC123065936 [Triticum aestivum]KAF7031629.1 hypothetical protein CFC21_042933 [Triticum aestivum]